MRVYTMYKVYSAYTMLLYNLIIAYIYTFLELLHIKLR